MAALGARPVRAPATGRLASVGRPARSRGRRPTDARPWLLVGLPHRLRALPLGKTQPTHLLPATHAPTTDHSPAAFTAGSLLARPSATVPHARRGSSLVRQIRPVLECRFDRRVTLLSASIRCPLIVPLRTFLRRRLGYQPRRSEVSDCRSAVRLSRSPGSALLLVAETEAL